jgi:hypothetical protein
VRTIQTFILRLLVDPAEPDTLRGALQPVPEGKPQPFVGEQELLALLRRMALPAKETPAGDQASEVS